MNAIVTVGDICSEVHDASPHIRLSQIEQRIDSIVTAVRQQIIWNETSPNEVNRHLATVEAAAKKSQSLLNRGDGVGRAASRQVALHYQNAQLLRLIQFVHQLTSEEIFDKIEWNQAFKDEAKSYEDAVRAAAHSLYALLTNETRYSRSLLRTMSRNDTRLSHLLKDFVEAAATRIPRAIDPATSPAIAAQYSTAPLTGGRPIDAAKILTVQTVHHMFVDFGLAQIDGYRDFLIRVAGLCFEVASGRETDLSQAVATFFRAQKVTKE